MRAKVTDLGFPITIEPHQILDCRFHDLIPVPNCRESITLNEQESRLFRRFLQDNRRAFWIEQVGELQCLYDENGIDYIQSALPLVGLKFILSPSPDDIRIRLKVTKELIEMLKAKIKPWKDLGVDMVTVSGVDLRQFRCPRCGEEFAESWCRDEPTIKFNFCPNCEYEEPLQRREGNNK